MTLVLFTDPVALTVAYLATTLPGALAAMGVGGAPVVASLVPTSRPPVLVRVQATGGQLRDVAHERTVLAVQCWHEGGELAASDMARAVVALLRALPDHAMGAAVTSVRVSAPYFFPDPDTATPRFQTTLELVCRPERNPR